MVQHKKSTEIPWNFCNLNICMKIKKLIHSTQPPQKIAFHNFLEPKCIIKFLISINTILFCQIKNN